MRRGLRLDVDVDVDVDMDLDLNVVADAVVSLDVYGRDYDSD